MTKRPTTLQGILAGQPKPKSQLPPDEPPVFRREMVALYSRIPPELADKLRDIAHERSKARGRRVTVNDIVVEQLQKLAL